MNLEEAKNILSQYDGEITSGDDWVHIEAMATIPDPLTRPYDAKHDPKITALSKLTINLKRQTLDADFGSQCGVGLHYDLIDNKKAFIEKWLNEFGFKKRKHTQLNLFDFIQEGVRQ